MRLCGMNLYLHGIGKVESPIRTRCTASDPGETLQGRPDQSAVRQEASYRVIGQEGEVETEREDYEREEFKFTTSNKQLNFLQHIMTVMRARRAASCCPTTCCSRAGRARGFAGGCCEEFDFHTLLRLPTGIFYKQGVKANVLFFEKAAGRRSAARPTGVWVYDFRTNQHFTLNKRPLKPCGPR